MLIATFCPGCTYSAGTFTIPVTALNTALTNDLTVADSAERLIFALLQIMFEKQTAGTISQPTFGAEVSNTSLSHSSWETTTNTFADRLVNSFLVSFDAGASATPLLLDADSITSV